MEFAVEWQSELAAMILKKVTAESNGITVPVVESIKRSKVATVKRSALLVLVG